jgi:nitrogen PTS system EIIA component
LEVSRAEVECDMNIVDLLTLERVIHRPAVSGKRRVLEILSDSLAMATPNVTCAEVLDSLSSRERLGSTGLGQGVAIPHGRIAGKAEAVGAFMKLKEGVDFDAPDGKPVDVLFALLVSEESPEEHLELLARLAGIFADRQLLAQLRTTGNAKESLALLRREAVAGAA